MLTGEPLPTAAGTGDAVVGGTISTNGRLEVRTTSVGAHTQLAQMAALAEQAQSRKAQVQTLVDRITRYHQPYHHALQHLLNTAHARFGVVHHINCHSMNAVSGLMGEGGAGIPRADIVLGDRDGSSCAPEFTAFVREVMQGLGYSVKVNDPFKGVELVRAYANPAEGRHSLQLEINKRLYMDSRTLKTTAGFHTLQAHLMQLLDAIHQRFHAHLKPLT